VASDNAEKAFTAGCAVVFVSSLLGVPGFWIIWGLIQWEWLDEFVGSGEPDEFVLIAIIGGGCGFAIGLGPALLWARNILRQRPATQS
jgi:hypothetical protein